MTMGRGTNEWARKAGGAYLDIAMDDPAHVTIRETLEQLSQYFRGQSILAQYPISTAATAITTIATIIPPIDVRAMDDVVALFFPDVVLRHHRCRRCRRRCRRRRYSVVIASSPPTDVCRFVPIPIAIVARRGCNQAQIRLERSPPHIPPHAYVILERAFARRRPYQVGGIPTRSIVRNSMIFSQVRRHVRMTPRAIMIIDREMMIHRPSPRGIGRAR